MITVLGDNLNILIKVKYNFQHDWMAFASWYSISKNLPDSKVKIICERKIGIHNVFNWPKKCKVDFSFSSTTNFDNYIEIPVHSMALFGYLENNFGPVEANSTNENYTFCSYLNGCGNFNLKTFENTCPFSYFSSLLSDELTINELRILKIWDKAYKAYINVI